MTEDRSGSAAPGGAARRCPGQLEQANDAAALEQWRVAHLGRKSALSDLMGGLGKLAPDERRGCRQAANVVKRALEEALAAREQRRRARELTARWQRERDRRHAARPAAAIGALHPITQTDRRVRRASCASMGFQVTADARGRDRLLLLRVAEHPALAPRARHAGHVLRRAPDVVLRTAHHAPNQVRFMEHAAAADPHHQRRPRAIATSRRRDARVDVPPGRGPRRRRGHHDGRPEGHADRVRAAHVRREHARRASAATTSRSSSRASTSTSRASAATARSGCRDLPAAPAGSRSAAPAWCTRGARARRLRPRALHRLRLGHGRRAHRDDQVRHRRHPPLLRNDLRFLEQFA